MAAIRPEGGPRSEGAPVRAVRARAAGLVQGVGFRWAAVREARRLGLSGRVRNEQDGSVAAYAEGPSVAVDAFCAWLRRGPDGARVESLEVEDALPHGRYLDFDVDF